MYRLQSLRALSIHMMKYF